MNQPNTTLKSFLYIIAALAGAGFIIYAAFFYTNPSISSQPASIIPKSTEQKDVANYNEPVLGNPNAPVTMIEYGSYLCGHCIDFSKNIFPKINENYIQTNKVKFIYRSFPPYELGLALMCANDQNKFWEYHEQGINNSITKADDLKAFAGKIGLDQNAFDQCFDSGKYQAAIENLIAQAQDEGITGTPSFFINDQKIIGALPYEEFEKAIEAELKWADR